MMRRAEGSAVHNRLVGWQHPCHRIDAGGLDCLIEAQLGQNRRQSLCQHTLSGSRRPNQQQVVSAGCGDFQRTLGKWLTLDLP